MNVVSATTTTVALTTRRGLTSDVHVRGAENGGTPVVFLHSLVGLLHDEPLLDALAKDHAVYAPVWPGYGAASGEEQLEDMLDFALHGWDVLVALGSERPHLIGHGLGGMIAAEMACLAPGALSTLSLLAPYGLWIDEHPLLDPFTVSPFDVPALLFANAERGAELLAGGRDHTTPEATSDDSEEAERSRIEHFMVGNSRRLGMAGKVLFPIPNRRLAKRLYRLSTPTLLVWGERDGIIPVDPYGARWRLHLPAAELERIPGAGHQLGHDQPAAVAALLAPFLARSPNT